MDQLTKGLNDFAVFKKVSLQTIWQLTGKVFTSLTTVLILAFITRSYGREGTGIFTLATAYLAFFYIIADLGVNAHFIPRMVQNDTLSWRKLFGMRLVWSAVLIAFSLTILLFWRVEPDFKWAVFAGTWAIAGSAIFVTANALFQSRLRYDQSIIASSVGTLAGLLIIAALTAGKFPVFFTLAGHAFGWLVTAAVALWLLSKTVTLLPVIDLSFIRQTIKDSWPISLTLILNLVYFRLDAFLLTALKGFTEVGIYNLAFQVFQSVLVLPTFIMNSFYPLLLENINFHRAIFFKQLFRTCLIMLLLAVAGIAVTEILAPWIITSLSGSRDFDGAAAVLRILAVSFPAFFVSAVLMWVFIAFKKYKTILVVYLAGLIFNITANYLFIPTYSYIASAWITVGSEYLILLFQVIILVKIFREEKADVSKR